MQIQYGNFISSRIKIDAKEKKNKAILLRLKIGNKNVFSRYYCRELSIRKFQELLTAKPAMTALSCPCNLAYKGIPGGRKHNYYANCFDLYLFCSQEKGAWREASVAMIKVKVDVYFKVFFAFNVDPYSEGNPDLLLFE